MWKRLPRWMWFGAWLLALNAGMVNVVGLFGFEHQALTHMTGLTSRLALELANADIPGIRMVGLIMISFIGGAALSGYMISDDALALGRRYGVALLVESILLLIATITLHIHLSIGFCLAAFACGMQNAMASHFSGSVIRTTHVSGMFTDIGTSLGHWLSGKSIDHMRLKICLSTITGFFTGGVIGVLLYRQLLTDTLYFSAALTLALAIIYRVFILPNPSKKEV